MHGASSYELQMSPFQTGRVLREGLGWFSSDSPCQAQGEDGIVNLSTACGKVTVGPCELARQIRAAAGQALT